MIAKHKELLAHLVTVEQAANELQLNGCNMDNVVRNTRRSAAVVRDRIKHYESLSAPGTGATAATQEPSGAAAPK